VILGPKPPCSTSNTVVHSSSVYSRVLHYAVASVQQALSLVVFLSLVVTLLVFAVPLEPRLERYALETRSKCVITMEDVFQNKGLAKPKKRDDSVVNLCKRLSFLSLLSE